jgi:hypothetical protein
MTTRRGNTRAQGRLSESILSRDGYSCKLRLPGCVTWATEAHHLDGPDVDDPSRMVAACRHCNAKLGSPKVPGGRTRRPRLDAQTVLDAFDVPVHHISTGAHGDEEARCHCPFHPDPHPSFSINLRSGKWMCHDDQCRERNFSGSIHKLKRLLEHPSAPRLDQRIELWTRTRYERMRAEHKNVHDPHNPDCECRWWPR